jgi:peroxin-6
VIPFTCSVSLPSPQPSLPDARLSGIYLASQDFNTSLDQSRSSYSESIGAPKIPNVTWDDVGGLVKVKKEILETVQLPLERPELFEGGVRKRSGKSIVGSV